MAALMRMPARACIVALACALSPIAGAQPTPERDATTATLPSPPERLFLVVFSLGPAWVAGKPPPEQAGFREHSANLRRLREAQRIAMGARYADKGMIVLRAASEAAARAEIEADPGVVAGIFTFDVNELRVFYPGMVGHASP